jgi:hypothetical protein
MNYNLHVAKKAAHNIITQKRIQLAGLGFFSSSKKSKILDHAKRARIHNITRFLFLFFINTIHTIERRVWCVRLCSVCFILFSNKQNCSMIYREEEDDEEERARGTSNLYIIN